MSHKDVAIIGIACRFAKIDHYKDLWSVIKNNKSMIREFPQSRKEEIETITNSQLNGQYIKAAYLDTIMDFEPEIFSISKEEAKFMDPQHRLLLELTEGALLDAGYNPEQLSGTPIGVYVGHSKNVYKELYQNTSPLEFTNGLDAVDAARISHCYNFIGPVLSLDTACSSSLVALNQAVNEIIMGHIEEAVVGSVNLILHPIKATNGQELMNRILSSDFTTRAFSDDSNGFAMGEGGVVLYLKEYQKAVEDRDSIHAIIKGSSINSNGRRANGIAAPSAAAQSEVIQQALSISMLSARDIGYIETHGTATRNGDPIELEGIQNALVNQIEQKQSIGIGSVKSNLGHTGAVSGLLNIIKVITMMKHNEKVATLNFDYPNSYFDFEDSVVYTCILNEKWEKKLCAGISSFGLTGTNAHVIIQKPMNDLHTRNEKKVFRDEIVVISSRTKKSLYYVLKQLGEYLDLNREQNFQDIIFTLNNGRRQLKYKFAAVVSSNEQLITKIDEKISDFFWEKSIDIIRPKTAFIFSDLCIGVSAKQYIERYVNLTNTLNQFSVQCDAMIGIGNGKVIVDYLQNRISYNTTISQLNNKNIVLESEVTDSRISVLFDKLKKKNYNHVILFLSEKKSYKEFQKIAGINLVKYHAIYDWNDCMNTAAEYINEGVSIDWSKIMLNSGRKRVHLPPYIFDQSKYLLKYDLNKNSLHQVTSSNHSSKRVYDEKDILEIIDTNLKNVISDDYRDDKYIYDYGVTSLDIMQFISLIRKKFLVDIPFSFFYEGKTLGEIKTTLEELITGSKMEYIYQIEKVKEKECYPASNAQKRMYVMANMFKNSFAYNVIMPIKLIGDIDILKFKNAITSLVKRHKILKTKYFFKDKLLYQKIEEDNEYKFNYIKKDVIWDEEKVSKDIMKYANIMDLDKLPILSVTLVRFQNRHWLMMFDVHHIATDGTSNGILLNDFIDLYNGETLKTVLYDYFDYAQWQEKFFQTEIFLKQKEYWKNVYKIVPEQLNMPTDYPRGQKVEVAGGTIRYTLNHDKIKEIKKFVCSTNITDYILYISVLSILLNIYTNQNDIIIGSPISGRKYENFSKTAGLFVNTIAIRNYPDKHKKIEDFIGEVKENVLNAFENQDYPFELLVDRVVKERNIDRNPLFDVMFAMQNVKYNAKKINGVDQLDEIAFNSGASRFDLDIHAFDETDHIKFIITYNSALFREESINLFMKRYFQLISIVIQEPKIKIGEIKLNEESAVVKGMSIINMTEEPSCIKNVYEYFRKSYQKFPNKTAVVEHGISYSYNQMNNDVNRLSAFLYKKIKFSNNMRVIIMLTEGYDFIKAIYSCWKCGVLYIPVDKKWPKSRISQIVVDSEASTMLIHKDSIKLANDLLWENEKLQNIICIDSLNIYEEDEAECNEMMNEDLWNYVGEEAEDEISGGGWRNSFTGNYFTKNEMDEYTENVIHKLKPMVTKNSKVLEIGCASGLTMYQLKPYTGIYVGTDLSETIIKNNKKKVELNKLDDIYLFHLPAHDIDKLDMGKFDLIIMNSVIHCFHGHNYLYKVLKKCTKLLSNTGIIFIGDVMDLETRDMLINELNAYNKFYDIKNRTSIENIHSKLFLPRKYFNNLRNWFEEIDTVECSNKIGTIKNELTKYRYDVMIKLHPVTRKIYKKENKKLYDLGDLEALEDTEFTCLTNEENGAYIVYTSGTTGQPKGVVISHGNILNYLNWIINEYNINHKDKTMVLSSMCFDLGYTTLFSSLSVGSEIHILDKKKYMDTVFFFNYIKNNKITYLKMTPTLIAVQLLNTINIKCKSVRLVFIGGENINISNVQKLNKCFAFGKFVNHYGPTETTIGVVFNDIDLKDSEINRMDGIIGKPINNISVYICNEDKILPSSIYGEICISGPSVSKGYLNGEKRDNGKFRFLPVNNALEWIYRTGDLGRILPTGKIQIRGRIDSQTKINGYRIEISEIDSCIASYVDIQEAFSEVIDEKEERYIVSYFKAMQTINTDQLKQYVEQKLPKYMQPKQYIQVEKLILTANGKLNVKSMNQISKREVTHKKEGGYGSETERQLSLLWMEVLQTEGFNREDDFFELGGYSIKAAVLANKIRTNMNCDISLSDIFVHTKLNDMALHIDLIIKENGSTDFIELNPQGTNTIFAFPPFLAYGAFYKSIASEMTNYRIIAFDFIESENRINKYIQHIIRNHPEGAVTLLGYSLGGSLALDVAVELKKRHIETEKIIMYDSNKMDDTVHIDIDNILNEYKNGIDVEDNIAFQKAYEQQIKKTRKYLEYYRDFSLVGNVDCKIVYISAEDSEDKYIKWESATTGKFFRYQGFGSHFHMFDKKYIDKNLSFIKND